MKKPKSDTPFRSGSAVARNLAPLVEQVRRLVQSARSAAAASVNSLQVRTNFEIGQIIVQHEQQLFAVLFEHVESAGADKCFDFAATNAAVGLPHLLAGRRVLHHLHASVHH